jgi:hypothetical protein
MKERKVKKYIKIAKNDTARLTQPQFNYLLRSLNKALRVVNPYMRYSLGKIKNASQLLDWMKEHKFAEPQIKGVDTMRAPVHQIQDSLGDEYERTGFIVTESNKQFFVDCDIKINAPKMDLVVLPTIASA